MYSCEIVLDILKYIENNLPQFISVEEISNYLNYNKSYLMRKFKKELGLTIIDYINIKKILNSLTFFRTETSILNIALRSGYNSQEYFSEMFKKIIGVNPITYKKFALRHLDTSDKELLLITRSLEKYEILNSKIEKYRNNVSYNETRRVLSIFK